MAEKDLDLIVKLLHPVLDNQDPDCPEIEWMGEDLVHCPGEGEWKCLRQPYLHGEYDQNQDYRPCNCKDYKQCPFYNKDKR